MCSSGVQSLSIPRRPGHNVCFFDDSCLRIAPIMLLRSFGIPSIATTHSDVPSHPMYQESWHVCLGLVFLGGFLQKLIESESSNLLWFQLQGIVSDETPVVVALGLRILCHSPCHCGQGLRQIPLGTKSGISFKKVFFIIHFQPYTKRR